MTASAVSGNRRIRSRCGRSAVGAKGPLGDVLVTSEIVQVVDPLTGVVHGDAREDRYLLTLSCGVLAEGLGRSCENDPVRP